MEKRWTVYQANNKLFDPSRSSLQLCLASRDRILAAEASIIHTSIGTSCCLCGCSLECFIYGSRSRGKNCETRGSVCSSGVYLPRQSNFPDYSYKYQSATKLRLSTAQWVQRINNPFTPKFKTTLSHLWKKFYWNFKEIVVRVCSMMITSHLSKLWKAKSSILSVWCFLSDEAVGGILNWSLVSLRAHVYHKTETNGFGRWRWRPIYRRSHIFKFVMNFFFFSSVCRQWPSPAVEVPRRLQRMHGRSVQARDLRRRCDGSGNEKPDPVAFGGLLQKWQDRNSSWQQRHPNCERLMPVHNPKRRYQEKADLSQGAQSRFELLANVSEPAVLRTVQRFTATPVKRAGYFPANLWHGPWRGSRNGSRAAVEST